MQELGYNRKEPAGLRLLHSGCTVAHAQLTRVAISGSALYDNIRNPLQGTPFTALDVCVLTRQQESEKCYVSETSHNNTLRRLAFLMSYAILI